MIVPFSELVHTHEAHDVLNIAFQHICSLVACLGSETWVESFSSFTDLPQKTQRCKTKPSDTAQLALVYKGVAEVDVAQYIRSGSMASSSSSESGPRTGCGMRVCL